MRNLMTYYEEAGHINVPPSTSEVRARMRTHVRRPQSDSFPFFLQTFNLLS